MLLSVVDRARNCFLDKHNKGVKIHLYDRIRKNGGYYTTSFSQGERKV